MAKSTHGSRPNRTREAAAKPLGGAADPSCSMFSPSLPGRAVLPGSPRRLTHHVARGAVDGSRRTAYYRFSDHVATWLTTE